MGAAAEHRGIALISRLIDRDQRRSEFVMMDDLNALPKFPDAGTPLGPIHFTPSHNGWFALCPITGYGYWYNTLREAVRRWRVSVNGYDHGVWIAQPTGQARCADAWDALGASTSR